MSNYWSLSGKATEIPDNSDMNTYMTPGNFMCTTNNGVKTLKNCPVDNAFILKVSSPINSKNYVMQEYIDLAGIQVIRTYSAYDKTWVKKRNATKDDLAKSIDFRGNAKTLKVRSGTDGLKNIYLDIGDESGNTCSLAFLSDGENTVKLILNGKTVWTK